MREDGTPPRASHETSVKISASLVPSGLRAARHWLLGSSYLSIKYRYSTCPLPHLPVSHRLRLKASEAKGEPLSHIRRRCGLLGRPG